MKVLLINPWITDFAAYDFWLKPLGILYICGILKYYGYDVSFALVMNLVIRNDRKV